MYLYFVIMYIGMKQALFFCGIFADNEWGDISRMKENNQDFDENTRYTGLYSLAIVLRQFGISITEKES